MDKKKLDRIKENISISLAIITGYILIIGGFFSFLFFCLFYIEYGKTYFLGLALGSTMITVFFLLYDYSSFC